MGECVSQGAPSRDGGVSDASTSDGGVRVDGGARDGATSDVDDTPVALSLGRRGCQCATPGTAPTSRAPLLGLALTALALRRRRRA